MIVKVLLGPGRANRTTLGLRVWGEGFELSFPDVQHHKAMNFELSVQSSLL